MSNEYRGETDAKRLSRDILFSYIQSSPGFSPRGKAVILAGDCGDLRALRALGWPPGNILCADINADRVRRAREIWPEVEVKHADVREVISVLPRASIGLALLDFCGHLNRTTQQAISLAGARLLDNGCLSVTYLRGREGTHTPKLAEARSHRLDIEDTFGPASGLSAMEMNRRCYALIISDLVYSAYMALARKSIAYNNLLMPAFTDMRAYIQYHSGSSPMGVLLMRLDREKPSRLVLDPAARAKWMSGISYSKGGRPVDPSVRRWPAVEVFSENGDHEASIRRAVLRRSDLPTSVLADTWNLPIGTIAAWRAHETRGTYTSRVMQSEIGK